MAKVILEKIISKGSLGTGATWYAGTTEDLLNNTGKTDIRLDKLMAQVSAYTNFAAAGIFGVIVHLSDENGNYLSSSIADGTTTDATLTTLLNQWKDNVFLTDFRYIGVGNSQNVITLIPLEADTRRVLKPGQKLGLTVMIEPAATETTKSLSTFVDSMLWYSAAAQ